MLSYSGWGGWLLLCQCTHRVLAVCFGDTIYSAKTFAMISKLNCCSKDADDCWVKSVECKHCNKTLCYIYIPGAVFFPSSTRSHWLLWGHMTSNNKTVCRCVFFFVLYNKSHNDCSLGKQFILFLSNLNVSLGWPRGNKINCFPREQSLSV